MNDPKQAEFLLNHPLITDFFLRFHTQIYSAIKKAKTMEDRDKLASYGRCADEFERYFRSFVETGKLEEIAAQEKSKLEKLRDRLPRF